jgi:hypothetical protein
MPQKGLALGTGHAELTWRLQTLAPWGRRYCDSPFHARDDSGSEIRLGDDPARELARLDEVLTADVAAMCNSQGLDADEREITTERLVARYRASLGFLLASAQSGPVRPHGEVRILVGRAGSGPLPANLRSTPSLTLHADEGDLLQAGELVSRLSADCLRRCLLRLDHPTQHPSYDSGPLRFHHRMMVTWY